MSNRKKCYECYHDGCCEGLPYCNGRSFVPRYADCDGCGDRVDVDELEEFNGRMLCGKCQDEFVTGEDDE